MRRSEERRGQALMKHNKFPTSASYWTPDCLSDVPLYLTRHPETARLWLPPFQPRSTGSGGRGWGRGGRCRKSAPGTSLLRFFFHRGGRRAYLRGSARLVLRVGGTARPSPSREREPEKPDQRRRWVSSPPPPRSQSSSSALAGPSVSSGEAAAKAAASQRLRANRSPSPTPPPSPTGRPPTSFLLVSMATG